MLCQVLLAGVLKWQSQSYASFEATESLLEFEQSAIGKMVIEDGIHTVVVSRRSVNWVLPENQDLPVDKTKIDTALAALAGIKPGLPVASTASSQAQLDVASDRFQRRIELFEADQSVVNLYVGSSPGFRKAHIRRHQDEQTYTGLLNVYEFPVEADGWLDKSLLAYSNISGIKGSDFELSLTQNNWQFLNPPAGTEDTHELKTDVIESSIKSLESLRVNGIAGTQTQAETANETTDNSAEQPAADSADTSNVSPEQLMLVIASDNGESELILKKINETVVATRSDQKGVFEVANAVYESLSEIDSEALWVKKK